MIMMAPVMTMTSVRMTLMHIKMIMVNVLGEIQVKQHVLTIVQISVVEMQLL